MILFLCTLGVLPYSGGPWSFLQPGSGREGGGEREGERGRRGEGEREGGNGYKSRILQYAHVHMLLPLFQPSAS